MFPIRWSQPPWRNIVVRNGVMAPSEPSGPPFSSPSVTRAGMSAYDAKSCCSEGAESSYRNATVHPAMIARVTSGTVPEGFLSRSGIIA